MFHGRGLGVLLTDIQDITASARIERQGRLASRAGVRLKLLYVLEKASLVGYVSARQLEDSLAAEGVLERLLADGALAPDEGAVPPRPRAVQIQDARHVLVKSGVGLLRPHRVGSRRRSSRPEGVVGDL